MPEALITQLASTGLLGPIVVFLWLELKRTRDKLDAAQAQRVEDAEAYADRMLAANKTMSENITALRELIESKRGG